MSKKGVVYLTKTSPEGSSTNLQETKHDEDTFLIKRSNSVRRPSFTPGSFSAILGDAFDKDGFDKGSGIPGPIPESLSTTPGYELEEGGMFHNSNSRTRLFPHQQQPTTPIKFSKAPQKLTSAGSYDKDDDDDLINLHVVRSPAHFSADQLSAGDNVRKPAKLMSLRDPSMNKWRLLGSCFWGFSGGVSDGCVGALLPDIETYYNISYSVVSLLWLGNCIGFILVAATSHVISRHIKFHWSVFLPPVLQAIQFGIVASGTKFPVTVFAYFIGGIALALGLSQHNYYISRLDRASVYLGFFHGSYGIGATIGPLVATVMLSKGIVWHDFFFILLGIACFNSCFLYWAFTNSDKDFTEWEDPEEVKKEHLSSSSSIELSPLSRTTTNVTACVANNITMQTPIVATKRDDDMEGDERKLPSDFTFAVKLVKTWLVSFFVFFYQGAEVGYGSWAVTYFLDYRHGNKDTTGYISSGFWAGVTLSRFIVTPLAVKYIGNRRAIILLALLAILFDILSWVIPNVVIGGVMAAFVGISIGPIYPLMVGLITKILPRKVQVISMTIMTAFGSSGGALFPFLIGILSQFLSTYILHPIFIALEIAMLFTWLLLPNVERIEKFGEPKSLWQKIW